MRVSLSNHDIPEHLEVLGIVLFIVCLVVEASVAVPEPERTDEDSWHKSCGEESVTSCESEAITSCFA